MIGKKNIFWFYASIVVSYFRVKRESGHRYIFWAAMNVEVFTASVSSDVGGVISL